MDTLENILLYNDRKLEDVLFPIRVENPQLSAVCVVGMLLWELCIDRDPQSVIVFLESFGLRWPRPCGNS